MASVEFEYKIYDNKIEIIPNEKVKDNSVYDLHIDYVHAADSNKSMKDIDLSISTKFTPCYVSLESVKSLVESFEISDSRLLYYIRESSLMAEYKAEKTFDEEDTPFYVEQYVKYKSAYESLLRLYMDMSVDAGYSGTLSDVQFENPSNFSGIKNLLNVLDEKADKWEQDLMNGGMLKKAKPKNIVRGNKRKNGSLFNTGISGFGRGYK